MNGDWGQVCRKWGMEGLLWSRDCMSLSKKEAAMWTGGGGEGEWERGGALGFRAGIPESFVLWSPVLILSATLK